MGSRGLLASLVAAAVLGVPGGAQAQGQDVVTVTATDFHLAIPSQLPAGPTTFRLVNHGKLPHHAYIVQLRDGKTIADFVKALKPDAPPPAWAVDFGGPNAVNPGGTSIPTTVDLPAGHYAVLCVIPIPGNVPHVMKGMITPFTVTPSSSKAAPAPKADVTVSLTDYAFDFSRPLTAGMHHILVRNDGKLSHEYQLVRLRPGKMLKDIVAWGETLQGPPPGDFLGGVAPLAPGHSNEIAVNLAPGHYAALCFLPAPDGKLHLAHGMARDFTVK